jgi:Zn-dependent alcohol dehydrogenase
MLGHILTPVIGGVKGRSELPGLIGEYLKGVLNVDDVSCFNFLCSPVSKGN